MSNGCGLARRSQRPPVEWLGPGFTGGRGDRGANPRPEKRTSFAPSALAGTHLVGVNPRTNRFRISNDCSRESSRAAKRRSRDGGRPSVVLLCELCDARSALRDFCDHGLDRITPKLRFPRGGGIRHSCGLPPAGIFFFVTEATEPRRARSTEGTEPNLEPETRTGFARAALATALLGGGQSESERFPSSDCSPERVAARRSGAAAMAGGLCGLAPPCPL